MDQTEIRQLVLSQQKILEEMKLASFEIYQEIMAKYVDIVIARAKFVAIDAIREIEKKSGKDMDLMCRETLIGTIAVGIWAEISGNLNDQIIQQAISEPTVLQ